MTTPTPRLEAALIRFRAQPGVTADQEAQLRMAVTGNADRFTSAASLGQALAPARTRDRLLPSSPSLPQRNASAMTGTRHPNYRAGKAMLLCAAVAAIAGCAHSNTSHHRHHGADSMTEAPEAQPLTTPTTAAEMGRRFLKLIESIQSREELNLELIRRVTGIALPEVKPGKLSTGIWSNDLGGGWRYAFNFIPESPSLRTGVRLSFQHREDRWADMSAVCELDFDYYHDALTAMGFHANPSYGEIGQLLGWQYYKSDFVLSIAPQNVVAGQAGRMCVKSIGTLNGR